MTELFKQLLEYEFYDKIYNPLDEYIRDFCSEFNLERRTNVLNEVMYGELSGLEVIRVYNFMQQDQYIKFSTLVKTEIDILDYFADEEITDTVPQWFKLECQASLEYAEIKDIRVNYMNIYNK